MVAKKSKATITTTATYYYTTASYYIYYCKVLIINCFNTGMSKLYIRMMYMQYLVITHWKNWYIKLTHFSLFQMQ